MNSEVQMGRVVQVLNQPPYLSEEACEALRNELSNFLFGRAHSQFTNGTEESLAMMIEKMHTEHFLNTYHTLLEQQSPVTFYKRVETVGADGKVTSVRVPKEQKELEKEYEDSLLHQFESILEMNRRQLIKREPIPFNPATYGMAMALITTLNEVWKKDPRKYDPFQQMILDYMDLVHQNTMKSDEYSEAHIRR